MFEEDDAAQRRPVRLEKLLLDPLSIADLRGYSEELQAEIERVRDKITEKSAARGAADSFFKAKA